MGERLIFLEKEKEFIHDTTPSENDYFVIDANCQIVQGKAMRLLQVEFPETFSKMLDHIAKEDPYEKWFVNEERHYNIVVMFGVDKLYGPMKDESVAVSYTTNNLIKGIVKKYGLDKTYHSLIPYMGKHSNAASVLHTIRQLGTKWFIYK